MQGIEIHRHLHQIQFFYDGKLRAYALLPQYYDEIERLLNIGIREEQISGGML